jgi:hypothetical protein
VIISEVLLSMTIGLFKLPRPLAQVILTTLHHLPLMITSTWTARFGMLL